MSNYSADPALIYKRITEAWKRVPVKNAKQYAKIVNERSKTEEGIVSVTESSIAGWKKGTIPSPAHLITVCNICDCDIRYLLGEIDTPKEENHPIHEEIGLSDEAINALRIIKGSSEESNEDKMLLAFASHLFESPEALNRLQRIVKRMVKDNAKDTEYAMLPKPLRKICENAYTDALSIYSRQTADDASYITEHQRVMLSLEFWNSIEKQIEEKKSELAELLPPVVESQYYIDALRHYFNYLRDHNDTEKQREKLFSFTTELLAIVESFQDTMINKLKDVPVSIDPFVESAIAEKIARPYDEMITEYEDDRLNHVEDLKDTYEYYQYTEWKKKKGE